MNFLGMEKFQTWIVSRDLKWTQQARVFNLLDAELSLIWPLMKEFLQVITWFNPKIMKLIVQGILVFIIEKTVAKMLKLLKIGINKLLAKPTKEKEKEKE